MIVQRLAYQCGVDPEQALRAKMTRAEVRFRIEFDQADIERHLNRQAENLARLWQAQPQETTERE